VRVLAFDSSGSACSAAVRDGDRLLARDSEAMTTGQAERLVPMIAAVMARAAVEFGDLDLIAVTLGPGAFTGVRIGIATAEGLALASGRPVLGLTSFEAVASGVPTELRAGRALVTAIESRREELYLQAFDAAGRPLAAGALVPAVEWPSWLPAGPLVLAGDGAGRLAAAAAGRDVVRATGSGLVDAGDIAALAQRRWRPEEAAQRLEPIYLRAPDTTLPKGAAPT
jgi:tRNA threonylcarbamoyladenosine biosynthesis protein TsaB